MSSSDRTVAATADGHERPVSRASRPEMAEQSRASFVEERAMSTTTAVANVTETPRRSLLIETSARYGMEAAAFEQTLRATVVPKDCTREQFAAFLLVAREYDLNPILKEIYAFPARGGGIQPIVSIDGWTNIINSNPQLDGIEFDDHVDANGVVTAITCRIWRKDRAKPATVTEYLAECKRNTDTWKQYPRRMLRHKALIQCARYAFGLSGIVDPDEAERIIAATEAPPAPPVPPVPVKNAPPIAGEVIPPSPKAKPAIDIDPDMPEADTNPVEFIKWLDAKLATFANMEAVESYWNEVIDPAVDLMFPSDAEDALGVFRKHERRLAP